MTTMTPINPRLILDRLKNKTLVRREWGDGRKTACLLSAIHPPCAQTKDAAVCPATIMPEWLAELSTWMDDAPSDKAWHGLMERYADLASRWWRVTDAAWTRLDYTCRRIAVAEARTHAGDDAEVLAAIDGVLSLLDRAIAGDMPTADEWASAMWAKAAMAAAWAAAMAAAWAAAIWAVAAAMEAAMWAKTSVAAATAADRMVSAMLDAIEAEIVKAEEAAQ